MKRAIVCDNIHTLFLRMSNDVEGNPGLRVYDIIAPAKAVSAGVSQGSDVNNHQGPIGLPHVRTA